MPSTARLLLGAFPDLDTAAQLLQHVAALDGEVVLARWQEARAVFLAHSPAAGASAGDLDPRTRRLLEERLQSELLTEVLRPRSWRLGAVALDTLIVPQPLVDLARIDALRQRLERDGLPALLFPTTAELDVGVQAGDGPALTLLADRNELAIAGVEARRRSEQGGIDVVFRVEPRPNFTSVLAAGGRLFLRNGHHRLLAARAAGVQVAPCVIIDGSEADLRARGDRLPAAALLAPRPPRLADLAGGAATVAIQLRPRRYLTRFSAHQQVIEVSNEPL